MTPSAWRMREFHERHGTWVDVMATDDPDIAKQAFVFASKPRRLFHHGHLVAWHGMAADPRLPDADDIQVPDAPPEGL